MKNNLKGGKNKKVKKNIKKKKSLLTAAKAVMLILTAVFSLTMTTMAGAGLIYNGGSYGRRLENIGAALIISGVLMTAGAVFCIFRKSLLNTVSIICTGPGLVLCLVMLRKLCLHADSAGWTDSVAMTPISDMYASRLLPVIAPAAIALVIAIIQLFSFEAAEERRIRKQKKLDAENAQAPSIIE